MGAIASAILALAADLTREEQRPKVMATIGMFIGLSFTFALVIGPVVTEHFGLSWLILVYRCANDFRHVNDSIYGAKFCAQST